MSREKIRKSLRRALLEFVESLERGEEPTFRIPKRTLSSVYWDSKSGFLKLKKEYFERRLFSLKEARKFMQTVLVLSTIVKAIEEGDYPTIRDIYYTVKHTITYQDHLGRTQREETVEEQRESDTIIEDVEVMTGFLREQMGIMFDAKGRAVGDMRIRSKGNIIDLSKMGVGAFAIPPNVDDIEFLDVNANYILIVEKGAVFERLNNEEFWKKHKCILITGKGQPDRGTRRFVRRLVDEFGLPAYILTDADPYGFYIYSVYKYGSISLAYESERLAVPSMKFLGVTISDIYAYKIPKRYIIKATEADLKRAEDLLEYDWFKKPHWKKELELFLKNKEKIEIEAFSGFGFKFLSEKYIPEKMKKGKLLD